MKSQFGSFLLTLLFGPIGNFYGSITAGLMLTMISVVVVFTFPPIMLLVWPVCIIVGAATVSTHNEQVPEDKKPAASQAAAPKTAAPKQSDVINARIDALKARIEELEAEQADRNWLKGEPEN
jgi:Na+-transporting methylmalonyl-CoA/oxaloacetate decarboxylase gamma subunit